MINEIRLDPKKVIDACPKETKNIEMVYDINRTNFCLTHGWNHKQKFVDWQLEMFRNSIFFDWEFGRFVIYAPIDGRYQPTNYSVLPSGLIVNDRSGIILSKSIDKQYCAVISIAGNQYYINLDKRAEYAVKENITSIQIDISERIVSNRSVDLEQPFVLQAVRRLTKYETMEECRLWL